MARTYLIPHEGTFFKANLHSHGVNSDGALTPEAAKELYKKNGYCIYAYTDHNVLNYFKELNDANFLVLCGYELDITEKNGPWGFPKTCHINAIAREPEKAVYIPKPEKYDTDVINETIRKLQAANYIVNYNHPGWSAQESCDYLPLEGLTAMEIYNNGCEVLSNDGDGRLHYDIMLKHGKKLYCIAADDNHNGNLKSSRYCSDSCGGWTMIKAKELSYPEVISAFDSGAFYCSTGPEIYDYYFEENKLCVDCSPVSHIYVKTTSIGRAGEVHGENDSLTHFEFDLNDLKQKTPYIRFELVDSRKKMAFVNPMYL